MKEHDTTPEEQPSEVEIGNLPEKEFTLMILGWLKSSFRFFHKTLWKNSNELFDQPSSKHDPQSWKKNGDTD